MSTASNNQNRVSAYKNAGKMENTKKKRQEDSIQLRKGKRHDQLLKRRNICPEDIHTSPLKELNYQEVTGDVMNFEKIVNGIMNDADAEMQFNCTQHARKILSRERHPPITKMVESNIVNKLVEFLAWDHNVNMQFEATWALTNIASGTSEQTMAVVNAQAVPHLVRLLSHPVKNVVEQAMWALGNIAGDGAQLRDFVLDQGILKPIVALVNSCEDTSGSFLQNLTWTISNLCRNKNPHTSLPNVVQLLPSIVRLLSCPDVQVKTDVCWALSYITDGPNDRIELVLKTGVVKELVVMLNQCENANLITPVLRVVGNIVTGSDQQTQTVIDHGALGAFYKLLTHDKSSIQKEAAWAVSNITAGTTSQIQQVIDSQLVPTLIKLLTMGDYKTRKEACWAVTNFTSGGNTQQLAYLANHEAVEGLCMMLDVKESKILQVCLDGLTNLLIVAEKMGQLDAMCCAVEACGGMDKIEDLQKHDNETVYGMAYGIIDRFFNNEEEEEGEVRESTDGGYFAFGAGDAAQPEGGFQL